MNVASGQLYPSPLRYPGGKKGLANFIKLVMLENDLVGSDYVEPCAGGASVALSLLFEEYADHVHINDLNRSVHAFWRATLDHTSDLCDMIRGAPLTVEEWHRQRAVQQDDSATTLDLGFSTFYLNRTSRSGIVSGGGVIGGLEQTGGWKIDARYNADDLVRRVKRIGRYRGRISVTQQDAAHYLKSTLPEIERPFVYLDPPYYVKGQGLYQNFYRHEDHAALAAAVREVEAPWVVSYDAAPEILELYADLPTIRYDLAYTAHERRQGSETMFLRPGLAIPAVPSPFGVPLTVVDTLRLGA